MIPSEVLDQLGKPTQAPRPAAAKFSITCDEYDRAVVHMPAPWAAIRHVIPDVIEGLLAPIAIFYLCLVFTGFRGALIATLVWAYGASARRLLRRERVTTLLALDVLLLSVRTIVSFITGSTFLYFAQPLIGTVVIAVVLIASACVRRPFAQRFAHDFCPLDPQLLEHPQVQQFFVRISLMWATVLLLNAGLVAWLLASSSLRAFVLERTAITWVLTASAIFCSVYGFTATMRHNGWTVRWGNEAVGSLGT